MLRHGLFYDMRMKAVQVGAYTDGERIYIVAFPEEEGECEEGSPESHNCDAMGCPSAAPHIVQTFKAEGAWRHRYERFVTEAKEKLEL